MSVVIGGRVSEHAIATAGMNTPLGRGATKSQIMRYVFARGVGYSEKEATRIALGLKESATLSDSRDVTVRLPDEIVKAAEAKFPGKTRAWILRYLLAIHSEYDESQAVAFASATDRKKVPA